MWASARWHIIASQLAPTLLLAIVIVVGSVVHGMLIEGTMETVSKAALCGLVVVATVAVLADTRRWRKRTALRDDLDHPRPSVVNDPL